MDNGFQQVIREEVNEGRVKLCKELLAKHHGKLPPEVAADLLAVVNEGLQQPADAPQAVTRS